MSITYTIMGAPLLLAIAAVTIAACTSPSYGAVQPAGGSNAHAEIVAVMNRSAVAWTRGDLVEVDPLAPDVAHVVAWYVLSRGDSVVARGPTSLVMLGTTDGWKIVHDHSS